MAGKEDKLQESIKLGPAADRVADSTAMGNRADCARRERWLAMVDSQRSRDRGRRSGHVHRLATDGFRRRRADGAGPALTARSRRKRASAASLRVLNQFRQNLRLWR